MCEEIPSATVWLAASNRDSQATAIKSYDPSKSESKTISEGGQ